MKIDISQNEAIVLLTMIKFGLEEIKSEDVNDIYLDNHVCICDMDIAVNTDIPLDEVDDIFKTLVAKGMIEELRNGAYTITDDGLDIMASFTKENE